MDNNINSSFTNHQVSSCNIVFAIILLYFFCGYVFNPIMKDRHHVRLLVLVWLKINVPILCIITFSILNFNTFIIYKELLKLKIVFLNKELHLIKLFWEAQFKIILLSLICYILMSSYNVAIPSLDEHHFFYYTNIA